MSRNRSHCRKPRLENLENRWCPHCTVVQTGSTLFVTGDRTDNDIAIMQDAQGMHVACDGGAAMTFRDVARLVAQTWWGNDAVIVAYGTGVYQPADLDMNLGAGDDRLDLRAAWQNADRPVLMNITAGNGDDLLLANFTPGPDDSFEFHADLGAGDDSFAGTIEPPTEAGSAGGGAWSVAVQGQRGDDRMRLMLGGPDTGPAPHLINADLDVEFNGGAGGDQLMLNAGAITFGGGVNLDLDGSDGADALTSHFQDVTFRDSTMLCLDGGNGDDHLSEAYVRVDFAAAATVHDTAGAGNDQIQSSFADTVISANTWAGNVEGGTGADQVGIIIDYDVAAGASSGLNVDAGTGADQVGIIVNYDVAPEASGAITVNGGAGADAVGIIIDGCNVAAGASMRVDVNTGFDPDTIYFNWEGGIVAAGASMVIGVDSGSGNDFVFGHFGLDPESHGVIAIIFQGGSGSDNLTLDISGLGPINLHARVDGGDGHDIAHVTRNVDVVNCEEVFVF